ncbi:peptide ABC transporter permease [Spirochaetia bacterium]|nr:peptide ABC transporter permease [Spirochaetia bacterium]
MLKYLIKRLCGCVVMIAILSLVTFVVIDLPQGDFLSTYIGTMQASGRTVDQAEIDQLVIQYGLDQPLMVKYVNWIKGIITRGDFGRSFSWNRSVRDILAERMPLTIFLVLVTLIFQWVVSVPIAIYSSTHQYSPLDYVFNIFGFIGLSIPSFLLGLVVVYVLFKLFNFPITGLFSPEYDIVPWSMGKVLNLMSHIWLPIIILGAQGTASLIRTIRGNLIDELPKQYVTTARAKGLPEQKLLFRYPIRVAINPSISTIGWALPGIFSNEIITATVLNLESVGPVFLQSVKSQDMYLAGSVLLVLCTITILGTVLSDVLLALLDPRIRIGGGSK